MKVSASNSATSPSCILAATVGDTTNFEHLRFKRTDKNKIDKTMLDKFIKEKADLISFSQQELSNIATTLSNLKSIVNNQPEFREPFLGGSYKRATMVKGISDVDVYFRYTGNGNSQSALATLKSCLSASYPSTVIKQDKPSILADVNKIPINITPYKEDSVGNLSIPDNNLLQWKSINFGQLENQIIQLRQKNPKYIDLIKVLKLWNFNYQKGLKNFDIEKRVCNLFLSPTSVSQTLTDWLWTFFQNNGYLSEGQKIHSFMHMNNEGILKSEWLKFIDKK